MQEVIVIFDKYNNEMTDIVMVPTGKTDVSTYRLWVNERSAASSISYENIKDRFAFLSQDVRDLAKEIS